MIDEDLDRYLSYGWSNKLIADMLRRKYGVDCRGRIRQRKNRLKFNKDFSSQSDDSTKSK